MTNTGVKEYYPEIKAGDLMWVFDYNKGKPMPVMCLSGMPAFEHGNTSNIFRTETSNQIHVGSYTKRNKYDPVAILYGDKQSVEIRSVLFSTEKGCEHAHLHYKSIYNPSVIGAKYPQSTTNAFNNT